MSPSFRLGRGDFDASHRVSAGHTARHAMNKVKVLFLAANPAGTQPLKLDDEILQIIESEDQRGQRRSKGVRTICKSF